MNAVNEAKEVVTNLMNQELMAMIKKERKKRKMSYETLGKELGVSASYLFRLEKGERQNPSTKVLKALCELFDIDPGILMQMEPNVLNVGDKPVDLEIASDLFGYILNMDVDKTSDVMTLLARITEIQAKQKV